MHAVRRLGRVQRSQLFALFSAYYYQFWASLKILPIQWQSTYMSTFTYQFYEAQLPVFSINVEIIVRNVTSNDVQLQISKLGFGIPPISYT